MKTQIITSGGTIEGLFSDTVIGNLVHSSNI